MNIYKVLLLAFLSCSTLTLSAQNGPELKNSDIRQDIQDLANQAANDLRSCCSKWGGNNLIAVIHWEEKDINGDYRTRLSNLSNNLTIYITASWVGSISGTKYWIKGSLSYNLETGRRSWAKVSDSGGFSPGCSNECIY
jgi:hypothetical protein